MSLINAEKELETRFAEMALIRNELKSAKNLLFNYFQKDSTSVKILILMGYYNTIIKNYDKALYFADNASKKIQTDYLSISNFQIYNLLSWVLVIGNFDLDKGIINAQKSIEECTLLKHNYKNDVKEIPYQALPEYTLGLAYLKKGQWQTALRYLDTARKILPSRSDIQRDYLLVKEKFKYGI